MPTAREEPTLTESNAAPSAAGRPPREGTFVFLSDLLGIPVLGPDDRRLGVVVDYLCDAADGTYPRITAARVRSGFRGEVRRVEWDDVAECTPERLSLRRGAEAFQPLKISGSEIPLAQDVLDRQIVDTDGAKVERVNDLHLLHARRTIRVAHVDVGFRGLVRRLGWLRVFDALLRAARPSSPLLRRERFVPWKHVEPLSAGSARVKLDVARRALGEVHPSDLADILEDLDRRERAVLFRDLPVSSAADALEESEPGLQRELLRLVAPERAADIVEEMDPDKAADLISELPEEEAGQLLAAMEAPEAKEVQSLLSYAEDSAGGMMNTEFLHLLPTLTAEKALESVREQARELPQIHDAFVVADDGMLLGTLSLRDLLIAKPGQLVAELMDDQPVVLAPEDHASHVAGLATKYNLYSLPVLAPKDGRLLGIVTVDDVLEKVIHD